MARALSPQERRERMRLIRSKDTRPELYVRKLCWALGYRGYRLHRKDLAGKPDLAFIKRKAAIFVNGCFWHGHDCKLGAREPKKNAEYWRKKISRNRERDAKAQKALRAAGWDVLVIWECQLKDSTMLNKLLNNFLAIDARYSNS